MITYSDITVCMIHFNRPSLITRSLPSFLDFEKVLVWDNHSETQNTVGLKALAAKNKNVKIHWHSENVGWPKAINQLIINSDTDWVLVTADDMVLGKDFIKTLNELLEWKPNLEQIYLHTFDAFLLHKRTIAKMGWWDEQQPNVPPFWEDNDWYLRLNELLGFSPGYCCPGDHIIGKWREIRKPYISTKEDMERMDNLSYWSNCRWGISSINFDIKEISRDTSYTKYITNTGKSAEEYYLEKWKETESGWGLLNKDCTFWKRIKPEIDQHPLVTAEYRRKYGIEA